MKICRVNLGGVLIVALFVIFSCNRVCSQVRRSQKSYVKGGVLVLPDTTKVDSLSRVASLLDSLVRDSLMVDSLMVDSLAQVDSLFMPTPDSSDSLFMASAAAARQRDSLATPLALKSASPLSHVAAEKEPRQPFFSDSMSLSKMCWIATVLPGYGQVYNKQYWKLPILYGALGTGIALYVHENKTYKPLKSRYDELLLSSATVRTEELNAVQSDMIRSNTRRQIYMGATIASYIYFLGDAAINYSTNDVSDVKKATTLSMICPGAGQVYNKSYWRVPIVIGGLASMVYVYDWNNRGYQRFRTAYKLVLDYENDPESYPNGSLDEFNGAYSASYLQSLRDSYRRNRDYAVIITAAVYLFQVLDAHVDAHLKDFDISDDLTLNVQPTVNYANAFSSYNNSATYGLNLNFRF